MHTTFTVKWNEVTRFSQLVAILLFVGIFTFGIYLGMRIESQQAMLIRPAITAIPAASQSVMGSGQVPAGTTNTPLETYKCSSGSEIQVTHKGSTLSFTLESATSTYEQCAQIAAPVGP